jgi:hypothetical protein
MTLRLLVLLGIVAQAIVLAATWDDLGVMLGGDAVGALLVVSPALLGFGGAAAARALRRRGSRWAWVGAGVPLVLLGLMLCLAAFLWVNPITHQP